MTYVDSSSDVDYDLLYPLENNNSNKKIQNKKQKRVNSSTPAVKER